MFKDRYKELEDEHMAREKTTIPTAAPADDKKRAIDTAMAQIEKMYGKGSIMRLGDQTELAVE